MLVVMGCRGDQNLNDNHELWVAGSRVRRRHPSDAPLTTTCWPLPSQSLPLEILLSFQVKSRPLEGFSETYWVLNKCLMNNRMNGAPRVALPDPPPWVHGALTSARA